MAADGGLAYDPRAWNKDLLIKLFRDAIPMVLVFPGQRNRSANDGVPVRGEAGRPRVAGGWITQGLCAAGQDDSNYYILGDQVLHRIQAWGWVF